MNQDRADITLRRDTGW